MTTYPTVRLRLAPAAAIRARVTTTLNSKVEGSTGINVASTTGLYSVSLGFDKLGPIGAVPDKDVTIIPVYDPLTQSYSGITFHDLAADVGSSNGQALTKANDTNVTLTLTGNASTALLQDVTITAGWTGTLAAGRGGFGADVSASSGVPLFSTGTPTFTATTGSGNFVRATSATLVTPTLGAATATSINKMAVTAPATSSTLAVADGKTLTASNTLTLAGTDSTTITFQGTDTYVGRTTTDTLTNKSLTAPTIAGGTHTAITSLGVRSTGAAFDLKLAATSVYTVDRTLTFITGDANRTLTLSGDFTVAGGTNITPGVAGQVGVWNAGSLTGSATPTLGASGTLGTIAFGNATSGTVTLQPVTGALGTVTLSLPAATDTLIGKATTDTLTNKTFDTAGTGNSLKINGTAVSAITGTGSVVLAASPALTGTPTTPTATAGTNTTQIASTAFVTNAVSAATTGVAFFNSLTGTVTTAVVVQKFTSSGTYTPTSGMLHAIIECIGGGGGGGGTDSSAGNNTSGGGGGGGSYARKFTTAAAVGASQTVTIGAAGTAGSAAAAGNGGAGGDTSVGTICIGKGGSGGGGATSGSIVGSAGAGGVAGTGDVTVAGQNGQLGMASGLFWLAGFGGSSGLFFGQGAYSRAAQAGNAGSGFGGGGSGGGSIGATGSVAGGAGTAGIVIITEFINL